MNSSNDISREDYLAQRFHRFGASNGEVMDFALWKQAVRTGHNAHSIGSSFGDEERPKSPRWCFKRWGQSLTRFEDHMEPPKLIWIGGEHEDFYDPDFQIYNDVVVTHLDGSVQIHGYPEDLFPPTDFHTATFVKEVGHEGYIYIIGRLGYGGEQFSGFTPVFRLDLHDMTISEIIVRGDQPNWLNRHNAAYVPHCHSIVLWGGKVMPTRNAFVDNLEVWLIDLEKREWVRSPAIDLRELSL